MSSIGEMSADNPRGQAAFILDSAGLPLANHLGRVGQRQPKWVLEIHGEDQL